jgi:hypothetical protein
VEVEQAVHVERADQEQVSKERQGDVFHAVKQPCIATASAFRQSCTVWHEITVVVW